MAASAWTKFHKSIYYGMTGTIDYDAAGAGVFKCALLADTWTPDASDDTWADLSAHEIAASYGYSAGGAALTNVVFTNASGVDTWDADNVSWSASGGTISARYAVIYHVASGKLIRYCELEDGADKSAATGTDFVIQMSSSGIFSIT